MARGHRYFVYILSSKSRRIYTGMTNDLFRRVLQHKRGDIEGFTQHYEVFHYVGNAVSREKVIKGWLRARKVVLIERENPTWDDLAEGWGKPLPRLKFAPLPANSRSFPPRRVQDDNS